MALVCDCSPLDPKQDWTTLLASLAEQSWFPEVLYRLDEQKGILLTPSRLSRVPRRYAGTSSGINGQRSL
ncbi:hypothetical protein [Sutterella wadsworthensis]|uniref:hypothetical protein n=1 Tax=Sutterella wadsworthensis TaxID=40545 RepID=UPI0013F69661|nr:hypothetical protein [Sutterella wadsworthensis]MBT9623324.1 hypothetical protein [Sutterella wadsworthensis]